MTQSQVSPGICQASNTCSVPILCQGQGTLGGRHLTPAFPKLVPARQHESCPRAKAPGTSVVVALGEDLHTSSSDSITGRSIMSPELSTTRSCCLQSLERAELSQRMGWNSHLLRAWKAWDQGDHVQGQE